MFVGLLKQNPALGALSCCLGKSLLGNGECKSDFVAELAYATPVALAAHVEDRSLGLPEVFLGISCNARKAPAHFLLTASRTAAPGTAAFTVSGSRSCATWHIPI